MTQVLHNIAQIEFFHVGGSEVKSLGGLFAQMAERVRDGLELSSGGERDSWNGIKTTVRILDKTGALTKLALASTQTRDERSNTLDEFESAKGFHRWRLNGRSKRLAGKSLRIQAEARRVATREVECAIRTYGLVGIETMDRGFRPIARDEAHEVIERCHHSTGAWVFVFEPNHLYEVDNLTGIASVR